jgi:hypothetical protein
LVGGRGESGLELKAIEVGVDAEEFTPGYTVLSVGFALSEEESLVIQRAVGADVEEGEDLALVSSPSQDCVYEPFTKVELRRSAVLMWLTDEASKVFGDKSLSISFLADDQLFIEMGEAMDAVFKERGLYERIESVA